MMSASLSKLKRSSRLWVAVICAILSFLYFPVLCLLMVSSGRMEFVGASPADIHLHLSEMFSRILGFRQVGFAVITILLAIFMGLESFAYLDDKRKLDFYESQPVYRGRRFRNIYLGSLLIWLVSYLVNLAISLLIAGATGAMTGTLVLESLLESVIMTGLFAAVYSITVLAKILTGRILVSLMMAAYFFAFEPLLRAILNFFAGRYLMTYVGQQTRMFSSPIAYWIRGLGTVYRIDAFENLREVTLCFWGLRWGLVANLILAILAGGLAYLAYRKRGAEMAGCAVVFNWIRVLVKITGTSLCGLMVAVILDQILLVRGSGINQLLYVLFVFLMTTLIATLTEALLSMNIKAMGHRPWEAAISVGLVLLVFLVFRFDLLGYDRSQPGPDRIRSCALYDERLLPRNDDILLNSSYGGSFFYGNQGDSGLREGDPSQVGGPAMAPTRRTFWPWLRRQMPGRRTTRTACLPMPGPCESSIA